MNNYNLDIWCFQLALPVTFSSTRPITMQMKSTQIVKYEQVFFFNSFYIRSDLSHQSHRLSLELKKQKQIRHLSFMSSVVVLVSLFHKKMHILCSQLVTAFIKKHRLRLI